MVAPVEHPSLGGRYWRPAPAVDLSATPGAAGPFVEAGEHTRAILAELGYDDATIEELRQAGVVTWPGADQAE